MTTLYLKSTFRSAHHTHLAFLNHRTLHIATNSRFQILGVLLQRLRSNTRIRNLKRD